VSEMRSPFQQYVATMILSAPGVSTAIAAAIEDGIQVGIIVLTNADSKRRTHPKYRPQSRRQSLRLWRFLRLILPASQPDYCTVSRHSKLPRHAGVTARGDEGTPDVDLTGSYYNAVYEAAGFCSVHGSSPSCVSVLDDFRSIDPSLSPNSTSTDLFTSWVMVSRTHMRFTYTNNSQYPVSIGSVYPQGYGGDFTPFSTPGTLCDSGIRG
jgi:hypothetical protein